MEHTPHPPEVYDFRQYDRIWQRVAPGLEPYAAGDVQSAEQTNGTPSAGGQLMAAESQLPGAEKNPCCMGSAAMEMLEVLSGFLEEALADQRYYLLMARQAPSWARQRLGEMAAEKGGHARRLGAVYYLIAGECYRPAIPCGHLCIPGWCAALRERYHEEACSGMNYKRAAEGTTDPCLNRLLSDLSASEFRHADSLLAMLERSLRRQGQKSCF